MHTQALILVHSMRSGLLGDDSLGSRSNWPGHSLCLLYMAGSGAKSRARQDSNTVHAHRACIHPRTLRDRASTSHCIQLLHGEGPVLCHSKPTWMLDGQSEGIASRVLAQTQHNLDSDGG